MRVASAMGACRRGAQGQPQSLYGAALAVATTFMLAASTSGPSTRSLTLSDLLAVIGSLWHYPLHGQQSSLLNRMSHLGLKLQLFGNT